MIRPEIPEQAGEPEEVEVEFFPDDDGIKIVATLGDSSIVVEQAWDASLQAATLVQALPNIMIAVQNALNAQEAT